MDSHLSEQELLQSADGELSPQEARRIESHLTACWSCRARMQTIEKSIAQFIGVHRLDLDPRLPPVAGPRSLLKARLGQLAEAETHRWWRWMPARVAVAGLAVLLLGIAVWETIGRRDPGKSTGFIVFSEPRPSLTPGAVVLLSRDAVCMEEHANNRAVPVSVQRRVLNEYGIAATEARAYEVDYLITPALGGSDDIRNLWPQPYSATVWNAHVKDALEDRLRRMVCDGSLDLATAQRELSADWIAAYKKYFGTDLPTKVDQ